MPEVTLHAYMHMHMPPAVTNPVAIKQRPPCIITYILLEIVNK